MKVFLFVVTIFTCFRMSIQQCGNTTINYGASTSNGILSTQEVSELREYANRLVTLLMAEDRNNRSITEIITNNPEELISFHDTVLYYFRLVSHGRPYITDATRRKERTSLFRYYFHTRVSETLFETCSRHFHQHLQYRYNQEVNMFTVDKIVTYDPNHSCLCGNYQERLILNQPFPIDFNYLTEIDSIVYFEINNRTELQTVLSVSAYHVIPLKLILRFFETWLSDESTRISALQYNPCVHTLFGRLRRSFRKLLLVSTRRSPGYLNRGWDANILLGSNSRHFFSMFAGNIFIGPSERKPNSARFKDNGVESLNAFEFGVQHIIGHERYQVLFNIFNILHDYIKLAPQMPLITKLTKGFQILIILHNRLGQYNIVPFDRSQWAIVEVNGFRYWVEQDSDRRNRRSSRNKNSNKTSSTDEILCSDVDYSAKQWRMFVLDLIKMYTEAAIIHQELPWSCNFTCLYNVYAFYKTAHYTYFTGSFDEYLHSIISTLDDWRKCNSNENVEGPDVKWCLAWKNIKVHLNFTNWNEYKPYYLHGKFRSKSYIHNVKILLVWLTLQVSKFIQSEEELSISNECILTFSDQELLKFNVNYNDTVDESFIFLCKKKNVFISM